MLENCKDCSHIRTVIIDKQETYNVKGTDITITARVKKCEICNAELFDMNLDTENLKTAYREYKKNHHLMQSEEIVALRKKFHLTQSMLALLVGCTQATIARYEKGSIQSETHNTALTLFKNPDNIKEALEMKKAEFNPSEYRVLSECLAAEKSTLDSKSINLLESSYGYSPDVYSGFKKFDIEKLKAVVLFFALNQIDLYKTKLMKLLWYADMLFFKNNVTSITGMKYIHQKYGPVPYKYSLCLSIMEDLGVIELQDQEYGDVILPKSDKSLLDKLSASELEVLKLVSNRFLCAKAKDISEQSHKERGYQKTELSDLISYEYAFEMNY